MSLQKPYDYIHLGKMLCEFTTDNSVDYKVEFVQNISNFDVILLVFEIVILFDDSKTILNPPLDKRVEVTVVEIIRDFFSSYDYSVIFVCDYSDNRHHTRKRKFSSWYNKYKTSEIEKHDSDFEIEGIEFLTSLLIHQKNSFKKIIIDLFLSQKDQIDKDI